MCMTRPGPTGGMLLVAVLGTFRPSLTPSTGSKDSYHAAAYHQLVLCAGCDTCHCLAILYGLSLYVYVVVVHAWSFATDEDYCMVVETFGS